MVSEKETRNVQIRYSTFSPFVRNTRLVTIEPIISFFMLGDGIYYGTLSEFIQERIAILYNYTLPNNAENGTCFINESSTDYALQSSIQSEASKWTMYFTIAYTLPAIFMTVIIGSWSDSLGRKPAMIIPCAGSLLNLITLILVAVFKLPLEILIASSFVRGMCGGTSLILAACFTYIADVTTEENRTTRIIVAECSFLMSFSTAQVFGGILLNLSSFPFTFMIASLLTAVAMIYATIPCLVRETVEKGCFTENLKGITNGIIILLTKKDRKYKKIFAIVNFVYLIAITFTVSTAVFGLLNIYYLGQPFCFSYLLMSYYTGVLVFIPSIGLIMCATLLKRLLNDYWLIHLGMISAILFQFVSASARTTTEAFIGAGFGLFKGLFGPSCRSILSKMSVSEEQGAVFGFLGMIDAFGNFISPIILNNIYSATVYSMPTFVFWMCGSFSFLPIVLISFIQYTDLKRKKRAEQNLFKGKRQS